MSNRFTLALIALCLPLAAGIALAQAAEATPAADAGSTAPAGRDLPVWEAGIALAVGSVPDYPASDQSRVRALALPLFVYRGPVLRIEDGGVRGRFVDSRSFELDLSAAGSFNARNNDARAGMPNLDYLFQIGPQAIWRWDLNPRERLSAHLRLRAVFSTDFSSVDGRGVVFEPQLRWSLRQVAGSNFNLGLSASSTFATERLHEYFYSVAPQYARPDRPAFDAGGGYLGSEFGLNLNRRLSDTMQLFAGARIGAHAGAANRESPLFKDSTTVSYGLSLVWTPWRSQATVREQERDSP
jgi:outer membrane scaffolding protein for murein synthesis (MipA/OmpV family)